MTNNMEKFNVYLDQKVITWMRTNFSVEAESSEIARQKAIDFVKEGNALELSWEEVMDTKERMSLKDNGGEPTEEIFEEDGDIIYANKNEDE
jgi:hypothetical protein